MSVIHPWYQLGYVIPHLYTDMDAYQFYRVAPEGMMLVTTGLDLKDYTLAAVEQELSSLWQRFDLLCRAAARGRARPAGAAQHPFHDLGGAPSGGQPHAAPSRSALGQGPGQSLESVSKIATESHGMTRTRARPG